MSAGREGNFAGKDELARKGGVLRWKGLCLDKRDR